MNKVVYDNCKRCGEKFRMNAGNHCFCSSECRIKTNLKLRKSYYVPKTERLFICNECDISFVSVAPRVYCSNKCRNICVSRKKLEREYVVANMLELRKILPKFCERCLLKKANDVHHKTYKIPVKKLKKWEDLYMDSIKEYLKYIQHLCRRCHKKITKYNLYNKKKEKNRLNYIFS